MGSSLLYFSNTLDNRLIDYKQFMIFIFIFIFIILTHFIPSNEKSVRS